MADLTCLIVDDEPVARSIIRDFIDKTPGVVAAGEADSGETALVKLKEDQYDLVFMDINMPGISGLEVARALKELNIIFTTAYPEFAVEGFEVDALDYLVKPIPYDRFFKAVQKAQQLISVSQDHIWIKSDKKLHKIFYDKILFISAMGDYLKVHTQSDTLITHITMKGIQDQLPESQFVRVHKSYIVNISAVKFLEGNMVRVGEEMIPIGASYREAANRLIT